MLTHQIEQGLIKLSRKVTCRWRGYNNQWNDLFAMEYIKKENLTMSRNRLKINSA